MTPHRALPPYDWAALLRLIRSAFAGMEGRIDPPSSANLLTPDSLAAQSQSAEIWVIGTPALACMILTPRPHALYLGKLAVDEAYRGRGLSRVLIEHAMGRARALGLRAVELQTRVELTENHAAFRALGFTETGRSSHPGFDRPTTLTFQRPV